MFGKIYPQLYTGSMVGAGAMAFALWPYIITHARVDQDSTLELNPILLATTFGASVDSVQSAIDFFCANDPKSRTKLKNGRRLVKVGEFLYKVVNLKKWREHDDGRATYWREYRRKRRKMGKDLFTSSREHRVNNSEPQHQITHAEGRVQMQSAEKDRGKLSPLADLQDWQLSKDFERVTRQLNAELDRKPRDLELIRSCRQELNELKAEKRRRAPAATPVATPALGGKPAPAKASVEGNGQFGGVDAAKWAEHVAAAKRVVEGPRGG